MVGPGLHTLRVAAVVAAFGTAVAAQERPVVAAVNYPLAWMAERLGGEAVEVLYPVPAGLDPAVWQPTPDEVAAIQSADVILLNGAGFAEWTGRAALPRSRTVDTSRDLAGDLIPTESTSHSHGPEGEHAHGAMASHTWLDFEQAEVQAQAVARALSGFVPGEELDARLAELTAELDRLDARSEELPKERALVTSHPLYQYFGRAYGLDVRSLHWEPDAMPAEPEWRALEALAADLDDPVFVWEAEPLPEIAERLAETGLTAVVLPPLAAPPGDGDFASAMSEALGELSSALSR